MKTLLLVIAGMLVGCGTGGSDDPSDLTGEWSYVWSFPSGEPSLHGRMTLEQQGASVTGRIGLPTEYPAGQTWDMAVSGIPEAMRVSTFGAPAWDLDCDVALGAFACATMQVDDGRSGTFVADR